MAIVRPAKIRRIQKLATVSSGFLGKYVLKLEVVAPNGSGGN